MSDKLPAWATRLAQVLSVALGLVSGILAVFWLLRNELYWAALVVPIAAAFGVCVAVWAVYALAEYVTGKEDHGA